MSEADASAKLILFGEHAVVYGQPAIAIPLPDLRAHARVSVHPKGDPGEIEIVSADLHSRLWLHESKPDDPLAAIAALTLAELDFKPERALRINIHSDIPVAAGLGSGASVSIAIARALAAHAGKKLSPDAASNLAFKVEMIHHGSPSGIDNTVIAYEQPVYFVRDQVLQPFHLNSRLHLLLADTGVRVKTSLAVAGVKARREANPQQYDRTLEQIGELTNTAYEALLHGTPENLGPLMNRNQELLEKLGVSTPELDKLVKPALGSGALGAKLSGAGMGGYMAALVDDLHASDVRQALARAGGSGILEVEVGP